MAEAYNHFALNQYEQQKHTPFRLVYMEGLSLKEQVPIVPTYRLSCFCTVFDISTKHAFQV